MFWNKIFGKPTIKLEKAGSIKKSEKIGDIQSFTNSNGNTYYVTRFKRSEPIPIVKKSNINKKISSFFKN